MMRLEEVTVLRQGRRVLDRLSLEARPGELLAVIGPNGAGKSTLLAAIAGELRPEEGSVQLDGRLLSTWKPLALARRRAVMPQASQLGFSLPVRDVVALGRLPYGRPEGHPSETAIVERAMHDAGVAPLARRSYDTLSGGEQQRTQLARAIAQLDTEARQPPILLLDEPTASLDPAHAHSVLCLARDLAAGGAAVVAVLHDLALAYRYAGRVLVLRDGRVAALGAPAQAMTPATLGTVFGIEARLWEGNLVVAGAARA